MDRFSEDLDFTLLNIDPEFQLNPYHQAIEKELNSFGFEVSIEKKIKNKDSVIESAFIKENSKIQLLTIKSPPEIVARMHSMHVIKIKMEVDVNPPGKFSTEARTLLQPIPFSVNTLCMPDLFAGKIHALLCRSWLKRVKGRDWYDFVWYISYGVPVNLVHLKERLVQIGAWENDQDLTYGQLKQLLLVKINVTDFLNAKLDISPFIKNQDALSLWSSAFFTELVARLKAC